MGDDSPPTEYTIKDLDTVAALNDLREIGVPIDVLPHTLVTAAAA